MVPPGEGNEARGEGRRGVGVSHSTAEAGELSPRDPVEGRGHRQVAPVEGKTANTPRLGPVSTSRQRIAELARQALGMAVAIAWLPGPAGTRRRVAKPSVEEPDAAEPARPDLWGARVSNDPGLPDHDYLRCYFSVPGWSTPWSWDLSTRGTGWTSRAFVSPARQMGVFPRTQMLRRRNISGLPVSVTSCGRVPRVHWWTPRTRSEPSRGGLVESSRDGSTQ